MDTITHALLGGTIGQAVYGKRLSSPVKWIGALSAMLPDLDVFYGKPPFAHFKYHRGYTHAVFIDIMVGVALGALVWWIFKKRGSQDKLKDCIGLFVLALLSHPFLDLMTSYGTQVLLPFSQDRYAFNVIGAVDPGYTAILLIGLLLSAFIHRWGRACTQISLALSMVYLGYCGYLNHTAEVMATNQLRDADYQGFNVTSYPTLFQPYLRQVVARKNDQVLVGFVSLWEPKPIHWNEAEDKREDPDVRNLSQSEIGQLFNWFAQGQVRGEVSILDGQQTKRARITDLRYATPLNPTSGLWGIEATYKNDIRISAISYYHQRPSLSSLRPQEAWELVTTYVSTLWQHAFPKVSRE